MGNSIDFDVGEKNILPTADGVTMKHFVVMGIPVNSSYVIILKDRSSQDIPVLVLARYFNTADRYGAGYAYWILPK